MPVVPGVESEPFSKGNFSNFTGEYFTSINYPGGGHVGHLSAHWYQAVPLNHTLDIYCDGITLNSNTWYHVTGVYAASGPNPSALYINGVNCVTSTLGTPNTLANQGGGTPNLCFGGYAAAGGSCTNINYGGRLAEVGIWNVALSAGEAQSLASGVPPSEIRRSSLSGYWPLYGTNSPEPDLSGHVLLASLVGAPVLANHCPCLPILGSSHAGMFGGSSPIAQFTSLTGAFVDGQGANISGKLVLNLPFAGLTTVEGAYISPKPINFPIYNGMIFGNTQIINNADILPGNSYYVANLFDSAGTLVETRNVRIPSVASFNMGLAIQTSVTTGNLSLLNPANLTGNNTFTGNNIFTGTNTFAGASNFNGSVGIAGALQVNSTTVNFASKISQLNSISTVGNFGVPPIVAKADFTVQNTNIGSTLLYAVPVGGSGTYRISCSAVVTTVAGTSSTLPKCVVGWTDADNSTVQSFDVSAINSGNLLTSNGGGNVLIDAKQGTNINVSTSGYASNAANVMVYAVHFKLEAQ